MWRDLIHHRVGGAQRVRGDNYYRRLLGEKEGKVSSATKQVWLRLAVHTYICMYRIGHASIH